MKRRKFTGRCCSHSINVGITGLEAITVCLQFLKRKKKLHVNLYNIHNAYGIEFSTLDYKALHMTYKNSAVWFKSLIYEQIDWRGITEQ